MPRGRDRKGSSVVPWFLLSSPRQGTWRHQEKKATFFSSLKHCFSLFDNSFIKLICSLYVVICFIKTIFKNISTVRYSNQLFQVPNPNFSYITFTVLVISKRYQCLGYIIYAYSVSVTHTYVYLHKYLLIFSILLL